MKHSLTKTLNLIEFNAIIVNTDRESNSVSIGNNEKEESKKDANSEVHHQINYQVPANP